MRLQAIAARWYYQMYYDQLPMLALLGRSEKVVHGNGSDFKQYLSLHTHFEMHYNGDNVIEVAVSPDDGRELDVSEGALGDAATLTAEWTYSVSWQETPVEFSNRLDHFHTLSRNPVHLEVGRPCSRGFGGFVDRAVCAVLCCVWDHPGSARALSEISCCCGVRCLAPVPEIEFWQPHP